MKKKTGWLAHWNQSRSRQDFTRPSIHPSVQKWNGWKTCRYIYYIKITLALNARNDDFTVTVYTYHTTRYSSSAAFEYRAVLPNKSNFPKKLNKKSNPLVFKWHFHLRSMRISFLSLKKSGANKNGSFVIFVRSECHERWFSQWVRAAIFLRSQWEIKELTYYTHSWMLLMEWEERNN
jgi:hypothetical protein